MSSAQSFIMYQGHNSIKSSKNVAYHGWPTEKILGFKWPEEAQMTLKLLKYFLNMFRVFLVCQNNLSLSFSF